LYSGSTGGYINNTSAQSIATAFLSQTQAVSSSSSGCPSLTRVPVTVTVNNIPELTAGAVSNISSSTATGAGNITGNGGSEVTVSGICWSHSVNPTISDSKTIDGTLSGAFTSPMTGLTTGTYYVRAYATNAMGTAYGNQVSFIPFNLGTFANISKTFGDAPFVLDNPVSVSSGTFSYTSSNTNAASISGNSVTITGAGTSTITASQAASGSYAAATTTASLTVVKANQVLTLGTLPTSLPLNQFVGNLLLTASSSSGLTVTVSLGTESPASLLYENSNYYLTSIGVTGTVVINVSQAGNDNYNSATIFQSFDVTKNNQTITFGVLSSLSYSPGLTSDLSATASSELSPEFTVISGPASLTGNRLNISGAGVVVVQASQSGGTSWNSAPGVNRTLTVNKATAVITDFGAVTKTFGEVPFTVSPVSASSGTYNITGSNTAVSTVSESTVTIIGFGTSTLTANLAADANYLAATAEALLTVGKADQTITLSDIANVLLLDFEASPIQVTATSSSGLPVTFSLAEGSVATLNGSYQLVSTGATGSVTVIASQAGNDNYNAATDASETFTVGKADQTISFGSLAAKNVGDPDFDLNASSTSALEVTFTSGSTLVASISGKTATVVGEGTSLFTASQAGNNYYNAATPVEQTLTVYPCINPTSAGSITAAQTYCGSFDPDLITSSALPTGNNGSLEYKWQQSIVSSSLGFTDISNSNSSTYNPAVITQTTWYRRLARVTCQSGWTGAAESNAVVMTTTPDNTISLTSAAETNAQSVCINTAIASISYSTTGATGAEFSGLPSGVTGSWAAGVVTISGTPTGSGTNNYTVTLTGGCGTITSTGAITVHAVSVGGTVSGGATVCIGVNSTVLSLSDQVGTVQKWQSSTNGSDWTDIAETGTSYTANILTVNTEFRAVVQNGSCSSVNSASATITIDPETVAGTVTGGTTICTGSTSGLLSLSGNNGTISKWQSSTDGETWTDINHTSSTYTSGELTATTQFRVVLRNGECNSANSASATVTVDPASSGGTVSGAATVCSGENSTVLTLSDYTGIVVKWQYSTDNWTTPIDVANESVTLTTTNITATTKYRAVVKSGACSSANSGSVTVTVDPVSDGGTVFGEASVCAGTNSTVLSLNNATGLVQKWQTLPEGGVMWIDISNTTNSYTATNLLTTAQYRAVVQSGVCSSANSASGTVTVDQASAGGTISGGTSVCTGTNSTTLTLNDNIGTVVKWQYSTNNWTTPVDIVNATTTLTAVNLSATTQYRVVVQNGVCSAANSTPATVTVTPLTIAGGVSGGTVICTGETSGQLTLSGNNGTIVKWQSSPDGSTWSDIENTLATYTSNALTRTTSFRAVVKNGECSTANSTSTTATIVPAVGGAVSGEATVCAENNSTTLTLSGYTGTVQKWQSSTDNESSWSDIVTAISTTFTATNLTMTTQFRAVVQSGVCSVANSASVTVTVDPASVGGTVSGEASVCTGTNSTILSLSGKTGQVTGWQSCLALDFSSAVTAIANTTTTLTAANLMATTYYRAVVTSGVCGSAYSSIATISVSPCNPTNGGTIAASQNGIKPFNPAAFTSTALPGGQTGSLVYKWQQSTTGDFGGFSDIENSNSGTYDASSLTVASWFKRLAIVEYESDWANAAVSNVLMITVITCANPTDGGTIGADQVGCNPYDPEVITSTAAASGEAGTLEYKWQNSVSPFTAWSDIDGSNAATYDPPANIAATTRYKRLVRVSCMSDWTDAPESNVVEVSINQPSFVATPPTVADLRATGSDIRWYTEATGGTPLATTVELENGHHYFASQTVNGVESTARLDVAVTLDPTPCAPGGSAAQTKTPGQTLANLSITGNNIRWYSAASGGSLLNPSTVLVNGTHYWATQTINCTESATRLEVTVTVN